MKKIKMWLIILICVPIGYIGIHRIVYFADYKRMKVLNTEIYELKLDIIDYEAYGTTNSINGTSVPEINIIDTKTKYKKDIVELEYLKNITQYIK